MTGVLLEAPATVTEDAFAEVLAGVLSVDEVPVEDHFFDDLGADSMTMAQFCARVRKRGDLPPVSMKEVYAHPSLRSLAEALTEEAETADAADPAVPPPLAPPAHAGNGAAHAAPAGSAAPAEGEAPTPAPAPVGALGYLLCGALQLLVVLAYLYGSAVVFAAGYEWISAGSGAVELYLRTVLFAGAVFLGVCVLPVVVKWTLVGRWKPQPIRVWTPAYVRFWIVKTLIQRNPLVLLAGTPLYTLYLRALGAKVGRDAVIFSRRAPVCTDLLTVGERTVIHKDSFFTCYRAEAGRIHPGPVTLGSEVVVGEASVLDIDTAMGDGAQLGHTSSLQAGQSVPAGQRRHGFAAQELTEVDYGGVEPLSCGTPRKVGYSALQLLGLVGLRLPLTMGLAALLVSALAGLPAVVVSLVFFAGSILVGLALVLTVPRVLNLFMKPDRLYRMYGFHYAVHRTIERMTNATFFPRLLGDSSFIVPYLRWLGYDLSEVEQTGSNFGLEVKHENPFLCKIGSGTMVADGLSMVNTDFSSTSFRLSRTEIGAQSFLGNYIVYPPGGKTGDDVLLGTKAMVPIDGEVREGVGLLGSPSFEIPRHVNRDTRFDHLAEGDALKRGLSAKNRHNAVTIGLYLLAWWLFWFGATVLAWTGLELYGSVGAIAIALAGVLILVLRVVHFVLVERLSTMFRDLQPKEVSIYDPYFWWHERFWKLSWQPLILDGTPFKNLTWRLQGVRLGKRVFDDGCAIVEKTLVSIGDHCTLSVRSIVQAHSQESGAFKSDRIAIGSGCTLGIASLVHYGSTMGDGAVLAPDSFLMKGEEVPAHARWGGNPAASDS
jgi:non-ribosomal peptide synthetase-like protein